MPLTKASVGSVVLLVVIVFALANIARTCKPREGATLDVANYGGLGGFAATKIKEYLGEEKRVALIVFDESAATIYGKDQYALTEQLKAYGYKILVEEAVSMGPLFSNPEAAYRGVLPLETYRQVVAKHPKADAIVSFAGPPAVDADATPEPGDPPLIVANAVVEPATWELVQSGFVAMAILPREGVEANPMAMAQGDPAQYDTFFQAVTRQTEE